MAVFRRLFQRWGFIKLERYGLALTADDRIVSTRPAVLDDGAGQRIVGWRDEDLAMVELGPWASDRSKPPVIPKPSAASEAVMPVAVAAEAAVDEDDWEWTIALARARVAAEEAQAPQSRPARPDSEPSHRKTWQMAAIATPSTPSTPSTSSTPSVPVATPSAPARPASSRLTPATVIPVPRLPSIRDVGTPGRFEPVVRTPHSVPPASPTRFAKGTAPIDHDTERRPAVIPDESEASLAVGDRTMPGIGMPLAARTVELPDTRRRRG